MYEFPEKGTEILIFRVLKVVRGAQKNARFFVQKRENKNFWAVLGFSYRIVFFSPSTKCLPKTPLKPLGEKGFKNFQILLSTKCLPSGSFSGETGRNSDCFPSFFHFSEGPRGVIFA